MTPISTNTCTSAWLQACAHLEQTSHWRDYNVILEIASPMTLPPNEKLVYGIFDQFLAERADMRISTVINTIFPATLYVRHGADGIFKRYREMWPALKEHQHVKGRWGTYAHRITESRDAAGATFNPLKDVIDKLKKQLASSSTLRAAYELNPFDPFLNIPIYRGASDKGYTMGGPCLSHLSFKLTADHRLMLTAFYRSHYYLQRALGNLFGLAWLQFFVAREVGIEPASLICHSSMACLDTMSKKGEISGWNSGDVTTLLRRCVAALDAEAAPK